MKLIGHKKGYVKSILLAALTCFSLSASAIVSELPTTTVKGVKCYYYDVKNNESIYQVTLSLGVTREQITQYNPSAADGVKPRMRLYFPVEAFQTESGTRKAVYAAAAGITTHTVKRGESIYGIARRYGMSPDYLVKLNPQVEEGLKEGMTLRIVDEDATAQAAANNNDTQTTDADGYIIYEIKEGDTLYAIANAHNVSLDSILELNPTIDPLSYKAGEKLRIASANSATSTANATSATIQTPAQTTPTVVDNLVAANNSNDDANDDDDDVLLLEEIEVADTAAVAPLNVAVMLPFMLHEETQSRATQLYSEFFRGMLMAADDMRNEEGAQVNFKFYDTSASLDSVNALVQHNEMSDFDLVVAPDNSAQLDAIVNAVSTETLVLNIFAVKDESYKTHHNLIQTNIPSEAMYSGAINAFMEKYAYSLPVFISRNAGQADKDSFVRELKARLTAEGREYRELTFSNSLSEDNLAEFDPDIIPLVFVPNSGSKNEFAKFVSAITALRHRATDSSSVTVFGYPEWVTFRGDSFDELCNLDATIYSRYLSTDSDSNIRLLKQRYKDTYGIDMFEAVPTQGILGYDTARYIIKGLRQLDDTGAFPTDYQGIQSTLHLGWSGATSVDALGEQTSTGGLVNESLYIINYRPGGLVEWKN
jgi:LysM repeat protein